MKIAKITQWLTWSKASIIVTIFFTYRAGVISNAWTSDRIFKDDAQIFYIYLPSLFVHGDMSLKWTGAKEQSDLRAQGFFNSYSPDRDLKVPRMTMGVAYMNAPFFLMAHTYSKITGAPDNGYTDIYATAIGVGAIFYLLVGFVFIRKHLLRYFSEIAVGLTILSIGFCTNLYMYSVYQSGMSHTISFALISAFIHVCVCYYEKPSSKRAILIGFLFGLLVLVRPTNGVMLFFPLFYGGFEISQIRQNIHHWFSSQKRIFLIIVTVVLVMLPQLVFWKFNTGAWFYNSYQGRDAFYWGNPHIFEGLLGFNKGWLVYTPIMIFACIGIPLLYYKQRMLVVPVALTFCLSVYIMFSFWCWWYGGAFGCRPIIDFYGLLAIPMCAFYSYFRQWVIVFPMVCIMFFGFVNIFQTSQYRMTLIHWDGMSKELYWEVFLSKEWPMDYPKLLKRPDNQAGLKGIKKWIRYEE